jgi:hypothetical protein
MIGEDIYTGNVQEIIPIFNTLLSDENIKLRLYCNDILLYSNCEKENIKKLEGERSWGQLSDDPYYIIVNTNEKLPVLLGPCYVFEYLYQAVRDKYETRINNKKILSLPNKYFYNFKLYNKNQSIAVKCDIAHFNLVRNEVREECIFLVADSHIFSNIEDAVNKYSDLIDDIYPNNENVLFYFNRSDQAMKFSKKKINKLYSLSSEDIRIEKCEVYENIAAYFVKSKIGNDPVYVLQDHEFLYDHNVVVCKKEKLLEELKISLFERTRHQLNYQIEDEINEAEGYLPF